MPRIEREARISSPVEKVWDVVANLGEGDMWSGAPLERIDPDRHCIVCGGPAHELPFGPEAILRVAEWQQGRQIGYNVTGVESVSSLRTDIAIRPGEGGSVVSYSLDFKVSNESEGSEIEACFDSAVNGSLACLKKFVEEMS